MAPIGGAGGAPGDRPEEMPQWAADHDLTVEWYSGGATLTAAFRGLDLGQLPPLCLTTAIESAPTRAAEGTTIAPTGDGGCNGAAGIVGSIQTCLDLAVYPTAIAIAGAGRLVANVQQWDAGRLVTDLSGVVALDAIPPPFDRTALGC